MLPRESSDPRTVLVWLRFSDLVPTPHPHLPGQAGDVLIVDEPETYLHPRVQRQLLQILRETGLSGLATHSATLIASAQAGDVVGIERNQRSVLRYDETGIRLCERLGLLPT